MDETEAPPAPAPNADEVVPSPAKPVYDLDDPALYINRELSWLEFNQRVLEEALDPRNRLLERVKFLAITASNLDEFYTKRMGWLKQAYAKDPRFTTVDGLTITNPYYALGNTSNLFLMRTDAMGEVVWLKGAAQSQQDDIVHALALNPDSSGYVAGYYEEGGIQFDGQTVWDAGLNNGGFFVARFDPDAGVGITEARPAGSSQIHPNPAVGFFTVHAEQDLRSLEILDPLGSNVAFRMRRLSARSALVEVPGLSIGLYLVVVHTPAGRSVQRLVIE